MEKIYQIKYMYEATEELAERVELVSGKTPDKALKNWQKIMLKRNDKKRAYVTGIFEVRIKFLT